MCYLAFLYSRNGNLFKGGDYQSCHSWKYGINIIIIAFLIMYHHIMFAITIMIFITIIINLTIAFLFILVNSASLFLTN